MARARGGSPARRNLLLALTGEPWRLQRSAPGRDFVGGLFGRFRAGYDRAPHDGRAAEIVALLTEERPSLTGQWRCRAVGEPAPCVVETDGGGRRPRTVACALLRPDGTDGTAVLTVSGAAPSPPVPWDG
ncbi:hypothetical protein [Haloactinospora alba]|uniref:hypothetical protein n=1 Tax=Haloactinospora alba TaxID=405555 RepID=UPI00114DCED2|nr:hypothetical protein [Haloactinospora alba]